MSSLPEGANLGSYRIIEQIGMGGMATVYKAYQASMDRYVALKILPAYYAQDPKFVERFTREARTIAKLEHKNILPVYDFGDENGITYLAMRYLDGGTLKDVLALGRLTLSDGVAILDQVCAALDYAHRQGVVHRDVKPANIMIDGEGSAYLTDFGIAKVLESASGLTETGAPIGTPAYMAPEQSIGKKIDARCDIYALGVILYEITLGRQPYQADTPMAVALAHIHEPLPLPRDIDASFPEPIQTVILKALAKKPEDRYQTAEEMALALKSALAESGVSAGDTTLRSLATQARAQVASQTVKVSPETFARAVATAPSAPAPVVMSAPGAKQGSPGLIIGLVIGAVVLAAIIGAAAIMLSGKASAPGAAPNNTTQAPGAQVANATITPTRDPTLYDDFNNPQFDGEFDLLLWQQLHTSGDCTYAQHDGRLLLTRKAPGAHTWCYLVARRPSTVLGSNLGLTEAKFRVSADQHGPASYVRFYAIDYGPTDAKFWFTECILQANYAEDDASIRVVKRENSANHDQFLQTFPVRHGEWHTIQFTADPKTMAVSCSVDGQVIGSYTPDNADELKSAMFTRTFEVSFADNEAGSFEIDDVKIEGK